MLPLAILLTAFSPGETVYSTGIPNPLAAAVSLVVRLVRSRGEERKQIEWFVFAAALVPSWFVVNTPIEQAAPILFRVLDALIVYVALTAVLVALYFGAIVLSQQVFVLLSGQQSTLTVVASTLVIAALFNPLTHRTQSFVDRRFYRSKYDARKTLEFFSARLREETDLEALNEELLWVV